MAAVFKSAGLTDSERFLARLAERTFLSLWSYPNIFRDQGKELCDLLVVCGDHVLLFSDKSIEWPSQVGLELAWSRWYRRAIGKSAEQLNRSIRWVKQHPERLFLDPAASVRFPIDLPSPDRMQIHGIIVARGASDACRAHFGSGSGSLALMPTPSRTKSANEVPPLPFFIGNPAAGEQQVFHILDDVSLEVLLLELDTISDLTDYLAKKEALIASDKLHSAHGEEDLLAIYLKDINSQGDHDFVIDGGKSIAADQKIVIEGGSYEHMRKRKEYRRKKAADKKSYLWDALIERFADNIFNDKNYVVDGYEALYEPSKREYGLRHMALVDRLDRRAHALAIEGAFKDIGNRDRFFRAMLPAPESKDRSTGFFVLLLKRESFLKDVSSEDYRRIRANIMYGYALNVLYHYRYLSRVVGIATEGEVATIYRSEDLIYAEQPEWNEQTTKEVKSTATALEIFKTGPPNEKTSARIRPQEYPPSHYPVNGGLKARYDYVPESASRLNRRERRAAKARRGR